MPAVWRVDVIGGAKTQDVSQRELKEKTKGPGESQQTPFQKARTGPRLRSQSQKFQIGFIWDQLRNQ